MKLPRLFALILVVNLLIVVVLTCSRSFAADLPADVTLKLEALEKKREEALAVARKPVTDLTEKYIAGLARSSEVARSAGNLGKILAIDEEIKRVKLGAESDAGPDAEPDKDAKAPDKELSALRKTYNEHKAKISTEVLGKVVEVERRHADGFADMVKELTRAGMIIEAKHVLEIASARRCGTPC
jgi:hypothetical protein